jgi:hypothetical protein
MPKVLAALSARRRLCTGVEEPANRLCKFHLRVGLAQQMHIRVKPPLMYNGVSGISGREQYRQFRALAQRRVSQLTPRHALGQDDISE